MFVCATYDLSYGRYRFGTAVTEVVVAASAAIGIVVVGWLLVSGRPVLSRMRVRRSAESRPSIVDPGRARDDWIYGDRAASERGARRIPGGSDETTQEAEAVALDAELQAAEILARAQKGRETLLEEMLASAEREAREIKLRAEREAEGIVKSAELKAGEALVGVERARGRLERELQDLAREQARMAESHRRLSKFLATALEEIERVSANGSADVGGLQELRDELRSIE